MKIKASRKIIMAALALLMAVGLAAGSTFAWFSMNNKVTVDGMEVKTKVSSNLLIAEDTAGATAKKADNLFTNQLTQAVKGILEPVSTADALTYVYSTEAAADGSKIGSSAFIVYDKEADPVGPNSSAYADLFSEKYDVTSTSANTLHGVDRAVPYVDYVFQLKATNTNTTGTQHLDLTKLNLTYTQAVSEADGSKAHRVAIFVEDITSAATSAATLADGMRKGIYEVASAENFESKVVNASGEFVAENYVTSTAVDLGSVDHGTTKYFKITVRLWLEGQDKTCKNDTFMTLNGKWSLDLELSLVDTVNGVKNIAKVTPTPAP